MRNLSNWHRIIPSSSKQSLNQIVDLQKSFEKAIERFYSTFEMPTFPSKAFEELSISPSVDIVDDENHFKVEAEMPGLGEEDIQVTINDGILNIKGKKEISKQDRNKNYVMREISYGSYERNILLPESVDADKAKASFKKGMLWVDIPKRSESSKQSQKLNIEKA